MKKTLSLVAAMAVVGCSTVVPTDQAPEVPAERIVNAQFLQGAGTVIVKRDSAFQYGGGSVHLYVDGTEAAILNNGEKVTLRLAPGDHILSMKGRQSASPFAESTVTVKGDDVHVFRMQANFGETPTLMPTAF